MAEIRSPLFSICIPLYNCEQYLDQLFESIAKQTFTDWEVIVRDDGSSDESYRRCKEQTWIPNEKLLLITGENLGLSKNRSEIAQHASGEYIICVDADDYFYSNDTLQKIAEVIVSKEPDVVLFNATRDSESGIPLIPYGKIARTSNIVDVRKTVIEQFLSSDALNNIWAKAFRRELEIFDQDFPAIQMTEDRMFVASLLSVAKTICLLDEVIYFYRPNGKSMTNTKFNPNSISDRLVVESIVDHLLVGAGDRQWMAKHYRFKLFVLCSLYCDVVRQTSDHDERYRHYEVLRAHLMELLLEGGAKTAIVGRFLRLRPDHFLIALFSFSRMYGFLDRYLGIREVVVRKTRLILKRLR